MKKIKFLMLLVCFATMFSCSEDEGSDLLTEQEVVLEENNTLKRPSDLCDEFIWSNAGFHHSNVLLRGEFFAIFFSWSPALIDKLKV